MPSGISITALLFKAPKANLDSFAAPEGAYRELAFSACLKACPDTNHASSDTNHARKYKSVLA
jgi:hypothetical protein